MTRIAAGFLPRIVLDRRSATPLHCQIAQAVVRAMRAGALSAGERVPSTRALAGILAVSRNTVIAAYEELAARGFIYSRRGGGMRVAAVKAASQQPVRISQRPKRAIAVRDIDGNDLFITF